MKLFRRLLALLMAAVLCTAPALATEQPESPAYFSQWTSGLDDIMAEYMAEHGLSERNFSMGYMHTGTGEYWYFNEKAPMVGASLYKLPMNMRVTEKVLAGERSESDYVGGVKLPRAQYLSIAQSNNEISIAMQRYLAGFSGGYYHTYRTEIAKYSGPFLEDIPYWYYSGNYFNAEFMLNTLTYLYDNADIFEDIISYMKEASPGSYFKRCDTEYEIAHKYGFLDQQTNDVGIIYTPSPILLVVMLDGVGYAEQIMADIVQIVIDHTLAIDAAIAQAHLDTRVEASEKASASDALRAEAQLEDFSDAELAALIGITDHTVISGLGCAALTSLLLSMP